MLKTRKFSSRIRTARLLTMGVSRVVCQGWRRCVSRVEGVCVSGVCVCPGGVCVLGVCSENVCVQRVPGVCTPPEPRGTHPWTPRHNPL